VGERPGKDRREMRIDLLPWYFQDLVIRGFEGEDSEEDTSEDNDEENSEQSDEDEGEKGKGNENLKSALRKERLARRDAQKQLKGLAKFKKDTEDKEKTDSTLATEKAVKAEERATKLAGKLLDAALDNSIIKIAGVLGFLDLDDALRLVKRTDIEVDQDEDEPSEVEVDEKSVKTALEALKKAKPHLVRSDESDSDTKEVRPPKSGSKFTGGTKDKEQLDEGVLLDKYPALRRGSRKN